MTVVNSGIDIVPEKVSGYLAGTVSGLPHTLVLAAVAAAVLAIIITVARYYLMPADGKAQLALQRIVRIALTVSFIALLASMMGSLPLDMGWSGL